MRKRSSASKVPANDRAQQGSDASAVTPTDGDRQYWDLFRSSPVAIWVAEVITDADGEPVDERFLYVNPAFEEFVHADAADVVGRTAFEAFSSTNLATVQRQGAVGLTGLADRWETYSKNLDSYLDITVYSPRHGQIVVYLVD